MKKIITAAIAISTSYVVGRLIGGLWGYTNPEKAKKLYSRFVVPAKPKETTFETKPISPDEVPDDIKIEALTEEILRGCDPAAAETYLRKDEGEAAVEELRRAAAAIPPGTNPWGPDYDDPDDEGDFIDFINLTK